MAGSTGWTCRIVGALGAALIAGTVVTVVPAVPSAGAAGHRSGASGPVVGLALDQGTSAAVRDMPHDQAQPQRPPREGPVRRHGTLAPKSAIIADLVRQTAPATVAAPTVASFEGTNNIDGVVPPDTDGAVGPNDYVELVNQHYQVFSKAGVSLAGPVESAQMWSAFSSSSSAAKLCTTNPGGDGIVLYDRAADRWLFSELAFTSGVFGPSGPFVECFAVSQTGDPTGAYFVYAFLMSSSELPDYPKIGIWGNSYYLSANMFTSVLASSSNPEVWAFDRTAMINHTSPVQDVTFAGSVPSTYNTILPADVDGPTPPPAGSPEIFAGLDFATNTTMGLWQFSPVDWTNPGAATFTGPTNIAVAAYNTLCGGSQNCLPQPGTNQTLDAISDRVMYRLAYRNFGDHEALVVNHSVNAASSGTQAGVRWYEFDRPLANGQPSGNFTVAQQGTYAPDASTNRWMGSIAMDGAGDMALGYSATSASLNPSVMFTGRLKGDPAGQMTVAEGTIQAGGGAQTGYNRWGDYTRMAVDPVDDCTFWYVGEYYSASASYQWQTRIGSFKLSNCTATPDYSLSVAPASQRAIQGSATPGYTVTVSPSNGFTGSVSLSASGLPAGAGASFSPNPATTSSTLTVTTAATTPIGSYPLTITGTSGSLSHTALATLVVNPTGTFTLASSPPSQSVMQGSGTSYATTVSPAGGFNSPVALSVSGLPSGASGSFSPNPAVGSGYSSTLSVTTGPGTPVGTYTLTLTGTSGNLTSATTVALTVTANTTKVLHIVAMNGYAKVGTLNWKTWADVTVDNQNGKPAAGVTVTFSFTGGTNATRTCITNTSGYCSTSTTKVVVLLSQPSETIITTNAAKTGFAWDGTKFGVTLTL
jgi:hypothetical protein